MSLNSTNVLAVLDACAESFEFPMLDNGYVYLAKTRISLFRSIHDWAMVIEVFGFSPRAGAPDVSILTFASRIHDRKPPTEFVNRAAYDAYVSSHPHDEHRSIFPIDEGDWQDPENDELVAPAAREVRLRGRAIQIPDSSALARFSISMEKMPRLSVFELCRYLADSAESNVLATEEECRANVLPEMSRLLRLDEWNHPNLVEGEMPSDSETFQQLAHVAASGDPACYRPTRPPNTHWRHWPEGGRL